MKLAEYSRAEYFIILLFSLSSFPALSLSKSHQTLHLKYDWLSDKSADWNIITVSQLPELRHYKRLLSKIEVSGAPASGSDILSTKISVEICFVVESFGSEREAMTREAAFAFPCFSLHFG